MQSSTFEERLTDEQVTTLSPFIRRKKRKPAIPSIRRAKNQLIKAFRLISLEPYTTYRKLWRRAGNYVAPGKLISAKLTQQKKWTNRKASAESSCHLRKNNRLKVIYSDCVSVLGAISNAWTSCACRQHWRQSMLTAKKALSSLSHATSLGLDCVSRRQEEAKKSTYHRCTLIYFRVRTHKKTQLRLGTLQNITTLYCVQVVLSLARNRERCLQGEFKMVLLLNCV